MPTTTLTYFDFPASRGEECRLALHLAGVPFVDERLKPAELPARKPSFPFGALPMLTVEGHPPIGQSNAILRFVGRDHGLHPTEAWAAAREESIMESVEDMRQKMGPIARIKDEAEKKRAREEAATGYLPEWGGYVERQISLLGKGPFVGGESPHVVDLKLFVALVPYLKGTIDHVPADVFKACPRLLGVHAAVAAHPKVKEWYAK